MGDFVSSLLAFVVAIGVLVAVHEYGHYIVGRWTGMKVLRFSIGFGKPIWKRVGKDPDRTEYVVAAIPLGGYVRFLDSREGPVDPADEGRAFNQRPIPARIAVLLAGPAFNFLFAIAAYWALFVYGIPAVQPAVGDVQPGSYAAEAGLEYGDRIVAVGGSETATWEAALVAMLDEMTTDGRIPLTLEDVNGGRHDALIDVGTDRARLTEPGLLFDGLGFQPWRPPVIVSRLVEGGAAEAAGLQPQDTILAIDDAPVTTADQVTALVSARPGDTLDVNILRDGRTLTLPVRVAAEEEAGEVVGKLGIWVGYGDWGELAYLRKFGPLESLTNAGERMWTSTVFTLRMLARMVTGEVSIKNISGPINIAQFAGASAQAGVSNFLSFLAIVSISLGVLNLLPVPVLDGGQIVYQLMEAAKGSPLSERAQIIGQQVGIFALILLMSFAFYNDIARILSN